MKAQILTKMAFSLETQTFVTRKLAARISRYVHSDCGRYRRTTTPRHAAAPAAGRPPKHCGGHLPIRLGEEEGKKKQVGEGVPSEAGFSHDRSRCQII